MDPYALGSTPIPGDQPQGIDAKYDPEYTMVTEEIAKLGSATHGGSIVWATVATQGEVILETKSKDWQIAAYVAVAWQEIEGVAGIYKATQLFQALLENFWETSYPPLNKLRRRTNAFNWWHEYAYAALQKFSQDSELAEELVKNLAESLKNLDKLIGDLWPDATPLHDLQETVSRLRVLAKVEPPKAKEVVAKKIEEAPKNEPPPPVSEPQLQTPPQTAKQPELNANTQDFEALAQEFATVSIRYALRAHQEKAENPGPWQILRLAQWGKVKQIPPATNGQTHIPPPNSDLLASLTKRFDAGKYLEVALACEEFMTVAMFCLDVQYLADRALEALGDSFKAARSRVREETARLLERLPGIENLTFDDGTPFANEATKEWLAGLEANPNPNPNPNPSPSQVTSTYVIANPKAKGQQERFLEAERLCADNKLSQALQLLEEGLSSSLASNLSIRAKELTLLCQAKERDLALALAKGLLGELEEHKISSLDQDLALEVLLAAREAFSLAKDKEMAQSVQSKIGNLKPSAALGWKG